MNKTDMQMRRAVLLSARMRFSPETQPIRDSTIDNFLEYGLLLVDDGTEISISDLEKLMRKAFTGGIKAIGRTDYEMSLSRLVRSNRVLVTGQKHKKKYRLSQEARESLLKRQEQIEGTLHSICSRLFPEVADSIDLYIAPFLECLSRVFTQLGEGYVHQLRGDATTKKIVDSPSLVTAIQRTLKKHKSLNQRQFTSGVMRFFEDLDPIFDTLKWNLAQNYYISHIIGLEPNSKLLSQETFGHSTFYLDTNVLIHALEPAARYHDSFRTIVQACAKLKSVMLVCQITLDELQRVVENRKHTLPRIADQVPDETAKKVRGIFYQLYYEALKKSGEVDLDDLFKVFDDPMTVLGEIYGIELVDDKWFDEAADAGDVQKQIGLIQAEYERLRKHRKGKATALHDALLTKWITKLRHDGNRAIWIITLDMSLPILPRALSGEKPIAISLDALLHWLSPVALSEEDDEDIAEIFAEAMRYRLLPSELMFEMRDFLYLEALHLSCKDLPAEDVEACLQYLRINASELNPNDPLDREKIAREFNKFIADPTRKYKDTLGKLEAKVEEQSRELELKDKKLTDYELRESQRQAEEKQRKLRQSARRRLSITAIGSILLIGGSLWLANTFGDGDNWLQRVGNLIYVPSIAVVVSGGLGWFIIGKERLASLGWPFTKIFGSE